MAVTLYVGNLAWSLTEDELAEAFSTVTSVEAARIITDRETGRSRGFGFVEVADTDADKAINNMNGYELRGRKLIVNQARPRPQRF
jgi:RNA recognition motif-containing protein